MTTPRFLQIHFLTTYAANNLNRDDLSRPKSLMFGSAPRLRLSSQCIKRAWRISDVMQKVFAGEGGLRSREHWFQVGEKLVAEGHALADVIAHLLPIRDAFVGTNGKETEAESAPADAGPTESAEAPVVETKKGKGAAKKKPGDALDILKSNLFFFNASEAKLVETLAKESLDKNGPTDGKPYAVKDILPRILDTATSGDVAMFGRMVAGNHALALEGAVQVQHSFTVNKSVIDDDYFTAVDDLPNTEGGHIGSNGFGSGMYYGYVTVDLSLLLANLDGDAALANKLMKATVEAIATVAPGGKQNSFSARSYATYMMVETGDAQPRSFADAYLTPVKAEAMAEKAIEALVAARTGLLKAFPSQQTQSAYFNRNSGHGTFAEIEALVDQAITVEA